MKKFGLLSLPVVLLLAGCEVDPNFWNAETCNVRLEADIKSFENHRTQFKQAMEAMDKAARSGDSVSAEANKKSAENWKRNTESLLKFFDTEIEPVCKGKFRPELLPEIEKARKFLKEDSAIETTDAESMPDVRVTSIASNFVPYVLDERGECSGPYLDLAFTVSNMGGDFPRPVDLQKFVERSQRPAEELLFFTLIGELDFGGDMKKRLDLQVMGSSGGLKSGMSMTIPARLRIEYNQKHAKITGSVAGAAFLKTNENKVDPYQTEVDIPIWDIYTFSHKAFGKVDDDGKYYIGTIGTVTNLGGSPTPGPIQASFILYDETTGKQIIGWNGETKGPVSGNEDIIAKTPSAVKLPERIKVYSSIIPLCPNGKAGSLSDGDTKNNIRELKQAGGGAASAAASSGGQ